MKKKKVGVLVSAIATSAVCVSMVAGSTFALFTDEDSVNVAVTAANVKVDIDVERGATVSTINAETYGGFSAEGLALTNVTPGETYSFTVKATNASSIAALCKTSIEFSNVKLAAAFDVTIGDENYGAVQSYVTAWEKFDKGAQIFGEEGLSVEIAFPYSDESQNELQGLSTDIAVKVEAVQANAQGYTVGGESVVQTIVAAHDTVTAQKAIDEAGDNTTVFLAAGEYDKIYLNQSQLSKDISDGTTETTPWGHKWLVRTVKNLSIEGEAGTVLDGFNLGGSLYNNNPSTAQTPNPLTGKVECFYASYEVENLSISGIAFKDGIVLEPGYMASGMYPSYIRGLTITDCKTIADGGLHCEQTNHAHKLLSTHGVDDIIVSDCSVINRFQGVLMSNANNVTVKNNKFEDTVHNAIAVQGDSTGNILIENNVIRAAKDRAIRFNNFENGSIVIVGNVMVNSGDSEGELIKAEKIADNVTVNLNGNYWNGKTSGLESVILNMGTIDKAPLRAAVCGSYDFTDAAQEAAFCPDCYNGKGAHSEHKPYLDIDPEKGVANVSRDRAWLAYKTLDWDTNRYEFSYDVDLTALGEGSVVAFDGGDANTWQTSIQIGFKKQNGPYYTYSGTTAPNGLTGCTEYSSNKASITYVFDITDGSVTVTVLLNSKEFRTRTYSSEEAKDIYWDVYTYVANNNETQLCALSNMKLTAFAK